MVYQKEFNILHNNVKESLFCSEIYYQQNGINGLYDRLDETTADYTKAMLFLSTMKYASHVSTASLIANDKPYMGSFHNYCDMLLIGAYYWMVNYKDSRGNKVNPVVVDNIKTIPNVYLTYVSKGYFDVDSNTYDGNVYETGAQNRLGDNVEARLLDVDDIVKRRCYDEFDAFVKGQWQVIKDMFELKLKVYNHYNGYYDMDLYNNGSVHYYADKQSQKSTNKDLVTAMPLCCFKQMKSCLKKVKESLAVLTARDRFMLKFPLYTDATGSGLFFNMGGSDYYDANALGFQKVNVKNLQRVDDDYHYIEASVEGFNGSYDFAYEDCGHVRMMASSSDEVQNKIYPVARWCMVTGSFPNNYGEENRYVDKADYKTYLDAFANEIYSSIKGGKEEIVRASVAVNRDGDNMEDAEKDFKREIYMRLKSLWDTWFCGFYHANDKASNNFFKVEQLFKNFCFIDVFYNNISNTLRLNAWRLADLYKGDKGTAYSGESLFGYLCKIVSDHKCMLFNFPDGINFAECSDGEIIDNIANIFEPYPVSKVTAPRLMDKIVIIKNNNGTSLDTKDRINNYVTDTFNIYSEKDGTNIAPTVFASNKSNIYDIDPTLRDSNMYRISYKVPSFGVAFSGRNNNYWKNLKLDMNDKQATFASEAAFTRIVEQGNSNARKVCFYGQDLYPNFQALSYTIKIDMVGNAQIQPLMYFELMNIPMFRGTYMVIRVSHDMKPGMMTTSIEGIKLSKVEVPYTNKWFINPPASMNNSLSDGVAYYGSSGHFDFGSVNKTNGINRGVNETNRSNFETVLNDYINPLYDMMMDRFGFGFIITSGIRANEEDNTGSGHYYGYAIDIQHYKGNSGGTDDEYRKMMKCVYDFNNSHNPQAYQIIFENCDTEYLFDGSGKSAIPTQFVSRLIHIDYRPKSDNKSSIPIGISAGNGSNTKPMTDKQKQWLEELNFD